MATSIFSNSRIANKIKKDTRERLRSSVESARKIASQTHPDAANFNTKEMLEDIAGANITGVDDFLSLSGKSVIFRASSDKLNNVSFSAPPQIEKTFNELHANNFFQNLVTITDVTKEKGKTPIEMMDSVVQLNIDHNVRFGYTRAKATASVDSLLQSALNIKKALADGKLLATFDTETLGGQNEFGYQELDAMTEFAMTLRDKSGKDIHSIQNLIGMNGNQKNKYVAELEAMREKPYDELTTRERVILDRFSLYGHSDTKLSRTVQDGSSWKVESMVDKDVITNYQSIDNAINGVNEFYKIGLAQDEAAKKAGYYQWHKDVMSMSDIINGKDSRVGGIVGYNSSMFDNSMMNRIIDNTPELKGHHINPTHDHYFDAYSAIKMNTTELGALLYHGDTISSRDFDRFDVREGKNTQTQMTKYFLDAERDALMKSGNIPPHVAAMDEKLLSMLFTHQKDGATALDRIIGDLSKVKESKKALIGKYTGANQQLFMVNQTNMFDGFSVAGGMNFVYDKLSDSYRTFSGYDISSSGVKKEGFRQTGMKRKGLYSHNIIELNQNSEAMKKYKEIFKSAGREGLPEYAVDNMYLIASTPIHDSAMAQRKGAYEAGMENVIYSIAFNKDQVEALLNSGVYAGDIKAEHISADGSISKTAMMNMNSYNLKAEALNHPDLKIQTIEEGLNGKAIVKDVAPSLETLFDMSTNSIAGDSAANLMRDLDFGRFKKVQRSIEHIDKKRGDLSRFQYLDRLLSESVSKGQAVTLQLLNAFGHTDIVSGQKKLYSNTVNKTINSAEYFKSVEPMLQAIYNIVEKTIPGGKRHHKLQQAMAFKNAMGAVTEMLNNSGLTNGTPAKMFAEDLNYVDFDFQKIFGERPSASLTESVADNKGFFSVRLNNGNSLLNTVYNHYYGDLPLANKDKDSFDKLKKFMQTVDKQEGFEGVFAGINTNDFKEVKSASLFADRIVQSLQERVSSRRKGGDAWFGYENRSRLMQNALSVDEKIAAIYDKSNPILKMQENINSEILAAVKNTPKVSVLDHHSGNIEAAADHILGSVVMPFKRNDFEKTLGFLNNTERTSLLNLHDLTRRDAKTFIQDMLKGLQNTNIQLGMLNDGSNKFALIQNNQILDTINMPTIGFKNSTLYSDIQGSKYVIKPYLDTSKILEAGVYGADGGEIGYRSSFGEAFANAKVQFSWHMKNAKKKGRDTSNAFISSMASFNQQLRESSPAIDTFNPHIFQAQFEQDINSIVRVLPELKGTITDLHKKGLIPVESMKHLEKIMNTSDLQSRKEGIAKMYSTERNAFVIDALMPLMHHLGSQSRDSIASHYASNASTRVKDVHLTEGLLGTGAFTIGAGNAFDNQGRPTINQFDNLVYYDKGKMTGNLQKLAKSLGINTTDSEMLRTLGVEQSSIITDAKSEHLLQNTVDESTGRKMATTISSKYAAVDTKSFRNMLRTSEKEDTAFMKAAKTLGYDYESLKEYAMNVNMYEQEILMDSRLHDATFNKQRLQTISARKELEVLHDNELITLENLKNIRSTQMTMTNGKVSYRPGKEVNALEHLITATGYGGTSQPYRAKYNGVFKGGYFNGQGELVSEKDLNKLISNHIDAKDRNLETISKFLDTKLDYKMYVMPKEDLYGYKIFQSTSEKGVINPIKVGLGMLDKNVEAKLRGTRFEKEIGTIHHNDYLEQVLLPQIQKAFGKDFVGKVMKERHAVSDLIFREMEAFKGLNAHFLINQNVSGHGNSMIAVKSAIGLLNEKGPISEETGERLKGLFGNVTKGSVQFENGKLILPSDMDGAKLNISALDDILKEAGVTIPKIQNENGEVIGFVGMMEASHVIDYQGGTSIGRNKDKAIAQSIKSLNEDLEHKNAQLLGTASIQDRKRIQAEILDLEQRLVNKKNQVTGEHLIERGLKYSDRTHLNLGRMRFDDDLVDTMKSELTTDEFNSVMKAYGSTKDGNFILSEGSKNKQVLGNYLRQMEDQLVHGDGAQTIRLKDKKLLSKSDDYLQKAFSDKEMSLDYARKSYSYGAGLRALEFNDKTIDTGALNKLKADGAYQFETVKSSDLMLNIKEQGHTVASMKNNPYTRNTIVDFGEEMGSSRYLAIGRQLERYSGDTLITTQHAKDLNSLISLHDTYRNDRSDKNLGRFLDARSAFIEQQQKDITGKKGLFGEMNEMRMQESHLGKGAGLIIHQADGYNLGSKTIEGMDRNYSLLKAYNPQSLDNAMFEGKSLLKHYSENKVFDAQFRSMNAFEKMGYFDSVQMKKRLKDIHNNSSILESIGMTGYNWSNSSAEQDKEVTARLLEKYGDMAITTRFPEIQEGSNKVSMLYLDRKLANNEARALGASGLSMKLDHDGDTYFAARMKSKHQESYLDHIIKGGKVADETAAIVAEGKAFLSYRAVGHNRYYEQLVQGQLQKEMTSAAAFDNSGQSEISKLLKDDLIGGHIYSAITPTNIEAAEKIASLSNGYADRARQSIDGEYSVSKMNAAVSKIIRQEHGDSAKATELLDSYAMRAGLDKLKLEKTSKILKTTIGEANTMNYKLRRVYDSLMDPEKKGYRLGGEILQRLVYEAEEGVISSKKLLSADQIAARAASWNTVVGDILRGKGSKQNNLETARSWIQNNISESVTKSHAYFESISPSYRKATMNMGKEDKDKYLVDNFLNTLSSMHDNTSVRRMSESMKIGETTRGVSGKAGLTPTISSRGSTLNNHAMEKLADQGAIESITKLSADDLNETVRQFDHYAMTDDAAKYRSGKTSGQELSETIKYSGAILSNMAREVGGKNLALGALGVAGAIMVSGFVGGNPSAPAQNQAQQNADEQYYSVPSLQDVDTNIQQNKQQGYVINVNARSKRGTKHIQNVLQQAMSRSTTTDVNIALNINDNHGNIDNRTVEDMLARVL